VRKPQEKTEARLTGGSSIRWERSPMLWLPSVFVWAPGVLEERKIARSSGKRMKKRQDK
jgi:hypothetical protein